jgi:hypothetical protein
MVALVAAVLVVVHGMVLVGLEIHLQQHHRKETMVEQGSRHQHTLQVAVEELVLQVAMVLRAEMVEMEPHQHYQEHQ